MSSYLSIYLEKKPKEGEEKGERLLLCSISRGSTLYEQFYDNRPGIPNEDNVYQITSGDLVRISDELERQISSEEICLNESKLNLSLIHDTDSIKELLADIKSDKEYLEQLKSSNSMILCMINLFDDVGENWSDFSKIYWRIE